MYRDLVFRPQVDTIAVETLPYRPSQDDTRAQLLGQKFLDAFIGGPDLVAGYVPFKGVAPADIDPGGPESPEAMAALDAYIRGRRERGDFERARQRLMQRGFPLGGV
jgi:hypothetical protein